MKKRKKRKTKQSNKRRTKTKAEMKLTRLKLDSESNRQVNEARRLRKETIEKMQEEERLKELEEETQGLTKTEDEATSEEAIS